MLQHVFFSRLLTLNPLDPRAHPPVTLDALCFLSKPTQTKIYITSYATPRVYRKTTALFSETTQNRFDYLWRIQTEGGMFFAEVRHVPSGLFTDCIPNIPAIFLFFSVIGT